MTMGLFRWFPLRKFPFINTSLMICSVYLNSYGDYQEVNVLINGNSWLVCFSLNQDIQITSIPVYVAKTSKMEEVLKKDRITITARILTRNDVLTKRQAGRDSIDRGNRYEAGSSSSIGRIRFSSIDRECDKRLPCTRPQPAENTVIHLSGMDTPDDSCCVVM
ncbi:uncharacterized protein LOC106052095 [Biomphalaria glabrata]|uniref:Uncharacterized protein LOC106052095 n=1 Tax=Biomphalaria glabrata TaxID=6526 RepID=A0A9W3BMQ0_BIOGL|nr:uncharacterized protein LOC106052095 [Biomphalaria glabrata]KAI8760238.1 hypothetical protein BgiMline_007391 [Biomphalaria glabrata]